MTVALLGRKIGMTRWIMENGRNLPVTVIEAGPCVVTQVRTPERDSYSAIQLGFGEAKPRRSTMPVIGHDAKAGTTPKVMHREIRLSDEEAAAYELGQTLTVDRFEGVMYVDVTGTSKGKGFQGPMKRHNFAGLEASHGVERKHRSAGSISGHATNRGTGPKLKKGKRMAGHMGHERVTVRSIDIVKIDPERNLLMVKGPIPGPNGGLVFIRSAVRLHKTKARKAAASGA
ncbi:MAG: 50S ribosomal protein L3 [Phycisphaerales bacterium]|nr:50S ribosomal protein L3 [Phycisphaerales bacterium]